MKEVGTERATIGGKKVVVINTLETPEEEKEAKRKLGKVLAGIFVEEQINQEKIINE